MSDVCSNCALPLDPLLGRVCKCFGQKAAAPDLADIEAACLRIQETWTVNMRRTRTSPVYKTEGLTIPEVHCVSDGMRRNDKVDGG